MSKISARIKHTRIRNGYGLICGKHGRLSIDHVPPQGAVTITKIELRHICEMMEDKVNSIKGIPSTNASKFRTIGHKCNSEVLGANDSEISIVNKELTMKIKGHFQGLSNIYNTVSVDINAMKYARAMIGHILAATSVTECQKPLKDTPYFTPRQDFVLGNDEALRGHMIFISGFILEIVM